MPLFKKFSDPDFQGYLSFCGNTQVHRLLPVTSNGVTCDKLLGASVVTSFVCFKVGGRWKSYLLLYRSYMFCKEVERRSLNPLASRASERSELARGAS